MEKVVHKVSRVPRARAENEERWAQLALKANAEHLASKVVKVSQVWRDGRANVASRVRLAIMAKLAPWVPKVLQENEANKG
jgi:hypothetical protein